MMKCFKTMLAGAVLSALAVCSLAADAAALADRHVARGLKCDMCHVSQPMKTVKQDQCLKCRSEHGKPRLLCDECHEFSGMKVP